MGRSLLSNFSAMGRPPFLKNQYASSERQIIVAQDFFEIAALLIGESGLGFGVLRHLRIVTGGSRIRAALGVHEGSIIDHHFISSAFVSIAILVVAALQRTLQGNALTLTEEARNELRSVAPSNAVDEIGLTLLTLGLVCAIDRNAKTGYGNAVLGGLQFGISRQPTQQTNHIHLLKSSLSFFADGHDAENAVGNFCDALEFRREFGSRIEVVQYIETVRLIIDEIRQFTSTPLVHFAEFRVLLNQGAEFLLDFCNAFLPQSGGENEDRLIGTFDCRHNVAPPYGLMALLLRTKQG